MGRACSTYGRGEVHTEFWLENLRERDPLGKFRCRWDNIKMDLQEEVWGDMDLIDLAEDSHSWRGYVNAAMNLRVP
jgi:hypothetical protein